MSPSKVDDTTKPLNVIVVGAGIGGLSACISIHRAGHNVSLLESAKELREIGAGVLISPNATRELIKWGLDDELHDLIVHSRVSRVLRWKDGAVLSEVAIDPDVIQKKYGAPTWTVHRADLHQGLIRKVKQLGIPIRLGSKVIEADVDSASVTISTGEVFQCDFIVGADGVRSKLRDILCGQPTPAQPTGDYAFQFALDIDKHRDDPVIGRLTREKAATAWWGGGRHVIGTLLRGQKLFNCVAVFPDDGSLGDGYKQLGADVQELRDNFDDWDEAVRTILFHADPEVIVKWKLQDLDPLEYWHRGNLVLLGDACHPMLPYLAQGASQAIEDAAVLGLCLGKLPRHEVGPAYQAIRYSRTRQIQLFARRQKTVNHLPDGPEQAERDQRLKDPALVRSWAWEPVEGKPAVAWNDGLFGWDAEVECRQYFDKMGFTENGKT